MKKNVSSLISHIRHYLYSRKIFLFFLVPYLIFVAFTYTDFGISIDEPIEYQFGEMLYARTFGKDPTLIRDFAIEQDNSREIWAYNHFHTMLLYVVNDAGDISVYHGLNLLFAVLGYLVVFELVVLATGSYRFGLGGSFLLASIPRFFGDVPANVKDPVFAIYYVLSLLLILYAPKMHRVVRVVFFGLAFGLACASRMLGYTLIPLYLVVSLYSLILQKKTTRSSLLTILAETLGITLVTVGVHAFQMPFVATNPPQNLLRLAQIAQSYPWQGSMLYMGDNVLSTDLPWHYLPVWILVTTPIIILVFWLISHVCIKNRVVAFLHLTFYLNVLLFFLVKPTIYDGVRHYLFLVVLMGMSAFIGWSLMFQNAAKMGRRILVAVLVLHFISVGVQYKQLHPYEYIYFNEIIGNIKGAQGKFETDYWGTSFREGAMFLKNSQLKPGTVGICGNQAAEDYFTSSQFKTVWIPGCSSFEGVDYMLASGRNGDWGNVPGTQVFTVSRQGVPLMTVFEIDRQE